MEKQKIVDLLNKFLEIDPEAIETLFAYRVPCNKELADHPNIFVRAHLDGTYSVSVLGLLNGIVERGQDGMGGIASMVDVICSNCNKAINTNYKEPTPCCSAPAELGPVNRFDVR